MSETSIILGQDAAKLLHYARHACVILLTIMLGLLVARLVWLVVDPAGAVSKVQPLPQFSMPASSPAHFNADLSILIQDNPFSAAVIADTAEIPDAPVTSLNLILKGVRASDNKVVSSAIIVTPDNEANAYKPGDEILDRVVLENVLADRVILRKDGALESLLLDGRNEDFSVVTRPGDEPIRGIGATSASTPAPTPPSAPAAIADPSQLLAAMTLAPETGDSGLVGYRLSARGDASTMQGFGFQPGDILVEFDGDKVGDFEPADIADRLSTENALQVGVQRGEETVRFTLNFDRGQTP